MANNHGFISVKLEFTERGFFLYPPAQQSNVIVDHEALAADTHTVSGNVVVTNNTIAKETTIGPVKVAWEVIHWVKHGGREVLSRFETEAREDDSIIGPGVTLMPFTLRVPSILPPYQVTIFDILTHRTFASILEPVPDYFAPSTHRDSTVSYMSSQSATNSRHGSDDDSSIHSGHDGGALSPTSPGSSGGRRDKDARRSSAIKSFFRRAGAKKAASAQKEKGKSKESNDEVDIAGEAVEKALKAGEIPIGFDLPASLQPSMANFNGPAGIVSCPCAKGEVPMLSWVKFSSIGGLGESELDVDSDLCVVGSAVYMHLNLTGLDPRTTIHQIRLVLTQKTTAGRSSATPGEEDTTEYTIFSAGPPINDPLPSNPGPSDYVWRGEIPRSADAHAELQWKLKRGSSHPASAAPKSLVCPPYAESVTEDSIKMSPLCRLPTPIIGAHATSPLYLDPRLSRTSHALRYEVIFSVMGEAAPGRPLPPDPTSGQLPEGTKRRFWVDNPVLLGSCMITPENVIVPTYTPCASETAPETHEEYLQSIAARSEPKSFHIPNTRRIWPEHQTLNERTRYHLNDTLGRCACVFGQKVIQDLVGLKEERTWAGPGGGNGNGNGEGQSGTTKAEQLESVTVQRAGDL